MRAIAAGACAVLLCGGGHALAREIAVDVGHYLDRPGVISAGGIPEFEFNRRLALQVRDALERRGHRVRLIGERGDMRELAARPRAAAGADLFVSIHHDSVRERYLPVAHEFSGYSLFVSRQNPHLDRGLACASAIGSAMRAAGFAPSLYHADPERGGNRPFADRDNGVHFYDNLAVARTEVLPALLFEAGVIVNREEEARLARPETQQAIAAAIAEGVTRCLN